MLLVKTYLDKSPIHGVGVFANELIKKGTVIWQFDPRIDIIMTPEQVDKLPDTAKRFILRMAIPYPFWVDNYCIAVDNINYMNHSDDPNVSDTVPSIALQDIEQGTELTNNYYKEDHRMLDNSYFNTKW